jgi:hypothetical protein
MENVQLREMVGVYKIAPLFLILISGMVEGTIEGFLNKAF